MKRSVGVTISAVIVLVGCGVTLVSSAFMALGLAEIASRGATPQFSKAAGVFLVLFMLALAIWGIATGINVLHLREWARISVLVFSGLLLVISYAVFFLKKLLPFP